MGLSEAQAEAARQEQKDRQLLMAELLRYDLPSELAKHRDNWPIARALLVLAKKIEDLRFPLRRE